MDPQPLPPPPALDERCYRHPTVPTAVHCTRCDRPICPECMIPAPVGHQCPECVRSARQEFRRPARQVATGPTRGFSLTNALLLVLVAVYGVSVAVGGAGSLLVGPDAKTLIDLGASIGLARIPGEGLVGIALGQEWRLFTAMFLHAGLIHLAMNGYVLYIFGNVIEQEIGRSRFLVAYVVTGLVASAASYAFGSPNVPSVGASGAIYGLFGVFLAYNWRRRELAFYAARVRTATTLIVINLVFTFSIRGIDWRAHVGGLVAGVIMGLAVDGLGGSARTRAVVFLAASIGLLAVTAWLTAGRTDELRALVSGIV
jgi:membrane associated rhomboid family serine protease